jgi:hypothetical protein
MQIRRGSAKPIRGGRSEKLRVSGPMPVIDGKDEDFPTRGDEIAQDGRSMQCN